jgi:hypothetical protein
MAIRRPGKTALVNVVVAALAHRGWTVRLVSIPGEHPARLELQRSRERVNVLLYIWNVSHGGATRSVDEFRIQITSGVTSFDTRPNYQTVILGWSQDFGVFVGFDAARRQSRIGASASLQISQSAIQRALEEGAALQRRKGDEIAAAIRPDRLGQYLTHVVAVHEGDLSAVAQSRGEDDTEPALQAAELTGADLGLGSATELKQRQAIIDRLTALEEEVRQLRPERPGRGHNNPPELLPDEDMPGDDILEASTAIKQELGSGRPNSRVVAERTRVLQRFKARLKDFAKDTAQAVQKNAAAYIGGAIVSLAVAAATAIPGLVSAAVDAIIHWLQMLF